jgi:abortive infection bacteriophage resistance protein
MSDADQGGTFFIWGLLSLNANLKPPLSYKQQINLLRDRKLIISDDCFAETVLSHVNYYRFSAYSLGLRKDDIFKENTTFEHIHQLYQFDVNFRYMVLQLIEVIEITMRTKISYHFAFKYDCLAYLENTNFEDKDFHAKFLEDFEREKHRQRNAAFVKHHNEQYNGKMPVWVASELFSFGMLSQFYSNMKDEDKKEIAASLDDGVSSYPISPEYLKSWLRCLVDLRNICAHYGRIYNRNLTGYPKLYKEHSIIRKDRVFAVLLVIKRLLYDKSKWETFVIHLMALLEKYEAVNLSYIGFPDKWDEILYK